MTIRASSIGGIPFGNTSGRPASPGSGQPYFNGELQRLERRKPTLENIFLRYVAQSSKNSEQAK